MYRCSSRTRSAVQPTTRESLRYCSTTTTDEDRLNVRALVFKECIVQEFISMLKCLLLTQILSKNALCFHLYSSLEQLKRHTYEQHVCEFEHGSFTPFIFAVTGGTGKAVNVMYRELASPLSAKWDEPYSFIISWFHCRI